MAQTRSGRPHKLTERDLRVLKHIEHKKHSIPSSKLPLEATSAPELFIVNFMKWVFMAEQPHTNLISPCAMPSVGWSCGKLAAIGLWSNGNVFSGVMNHALPSGRRTDETWFDGSQENATCSKT